jgi:hypothetical protein
MPPLEIERHAIVPGRYYGTPKELWRFRLGASTRPPGELARDVLVENADLIGLRGVLRTLRRRAIKRSVGGWHVIHTQYLFGYRVHRAYVTVHMNRNRQTYLVKNRAIPHDVMLKKRDRHELNRAECERLALKSLSRSTGDRRVKDREKLWFPVRDYLRPAFRFRVLQQTPRHEWIVYVDAARGTILSKYDNLALASGRARVFDPNPVIALGGADDLFDDQGEFVDPPQRAYADVVLRDLKGNGFLDGRRVTTSLTKPRVEKRPDARWEFSSGQRGFDEAMIYFHVDRAIRHVEQLGYRGDRRIFSEALPADANGTSEDNAYYSPGTRSLVFGFGGVDAAEDGEMILHEFGHALQDAICPDFGQSQEAAAMGEGFGDYFAASFTAQTKRAKQLGPYVDTVMSWNGVLEEGDPPCVRRLDGQLTYESFNHATRASEHDNGEIWSATLWDVWNAIGRDRADAIIVESHFQLDGFTSFAKGARAILDADRNLFAGRHLTPLKRIFHRRGIGPIE